MHAERNLGTQDSHYWKELGGGVSASAVSQGNRPSGFQRAAWGRAPQLHTYWAHSLICNAALAVSFAGTMSPTMLI